MLLLQRAAVRPFTDKQIKLVETFADQAVIAIENVRLFEAERQRTRELTESLEQQTATSEVLQVISSSPGDLQPVFQAMLENAVRLCDAKFGNIYRWDGELMHLRAAITRHLPLPKPAGGRPFDPTSMASADGGEESGSRRRSCGRSGLHRRTLSSDRNRRRTRGCTNVSSVPMVKENELIGSFSLYRQEVRPFTEKQIELVRISLPRPSSPSRTRGCSTSCGESLQQQTATADVLKVISRSPASCTPVFDAIWTAQ